MIQHLSEKFPDTLIIPAFGNNDSEYHDNPTPHNNEFFFYDFMFNLWFRNLPENDLQMAKAQKDSVYATFIEGGYYRVDLTDNLSVLVLNTLYYDIERSKDLDSGNRGRLQLNWLRK